MDRVWALSGGEYSDYRVLAIFATREQADEALRLAKGTDAGWTTADRAVDKAFSDNLVRIRTNAETTGKAGPQVNVNG